MNARIVTRTTLSIALFAVALPAKAADPQLINLVMPDVKALAGVNVDQAKNSPFGQYVLSQMKSADADMQKLITLTGFDPTRDVGELMVASNGTPETGLAMARGNFDVGKITAAATAHGVVTETYGGMTILKDPKSTHGLSFLSASLVVGGDLAGVKGAIDRQKAPTPFSATLATQVKEWSTSNDAWAISAVPPSALKPPAGAPNVPGLNGQGPFQAIQSMAGGVKFGNLVVVKAQAVAGNAHDATQMGDAVKLLASLAAMQAQKEPAVATLVQSLQVSTQGSTVNVQLSMPEDQLQQILKPKATVKKGERALKQM